MVLADLLQASVSLVLSRICLLFGQVIDFLNDISPLRPTVGVRYRELSDTASRRLWGVLAGINRENWASLGHDNTSPIPRASKVTDELLRKGIGNVGSAQIPIHVWEDVVPRDFFKVAEVGGRDIKPLGKQAHAMLNAIRSANDTLFQPTWGHGGGREHWGDLMLGHSRSQRIH